MCSVFILFLLSGAGALVKISAPPFLFLTVFSHLMPINVDFKALYTSLVMKGSPVQVWLEAFIETEQETLILQGFLLFFYF